MNAKFYLVGGAVRDKLLGTQSKDLDYAVEASSYEEMIAAIKERGGEIFLEKPEFATVRAKLPQLGAADYVLCRKDGYYSDGRRPDSVMPGTLLDDLSRRDFTINAMAIDENGRYIDPFNGIQDLNKRYIRCVGDARERFSEDSLRILRAFRFAITKEFELDKLIEDAICDPNISDLIRNVSGERIREELYKCFRHNTFATIDYLFKEYPHIGALLLNPESVIWLKPTLEQR